MQQAFANPQRTQGLQAPAPKGAYKLVSLNGPGVFVGGHVSKQGGDTDLTFVSLDIDGQNVVNSSYAAMRNLGFTQQNPYGLVLLTSAKVDNVAFGFPTPLPTTGAAPTERPPGAGPLSDRQINAQPVRLSILDCKPALKFLYFLFALYGVLDNSLARQYFCYQ